MSIESLLDEPIGVTASSVNSMPAGTIYGVNVVGWEPPSNRLAAALADGHGDVRRVPYQMRWTDTPRSVTAALRGGSALWKVEDGEFVQAVTAPSEALRDALARAAESPDLETIWITAANIAATMDVARIHDLAAAMVHPTFEVMGRRVASRLYRYQVACACAIASMAPELSIPVLEQLIFGAIDWSSGAAILALGHRLRLEPALAPRALPILLAVVDDLLPVACEPRRDALHEVITTLPGVADTIPDDVLAKLQQDDAEVLLSEEDRSALQAKLDEHTATIAAARDAPNPWAKPKSYAWYYWAAAVFVFVLAYLAIQR